MLVIRIEFAGLIWIDDPNLFYGLMLERRSSRDVSGDVNSAKFTRFRVGVSARNCDWSVEEG